MERTLARLLTAEGFHLVFGRRSSAADRVRYFLNMDFTKSQEWQADEDGLRRLPQARIDSCGFQQFFVRMQKKDNSMAFLSDHPSNRERLELTRRFANRDVQPILTSAE